MSTAKQSVPREVEEFIESLDNPTQQEETRQLIKLLHKATGVTPGLMSKSIITFGMYQYTYATGRKGETCIVGFSPRKGKFSFYLTGQHDKTGPLWEKLGKVKIEKGCLHIRQLTDVNPDVLSALITDTYSHYKQRLTAAGVIVTEI